MDDLQKIDLIDKMKTWLVESVPNLEAEVQDLQNRRNGNDANFYKQKYLSILFDIDDSLPAGRRRLRRLARLIELPPEDVLDAETVTEGRVEYTDDSENPWQKHPAWKQRDNIRSALEQLNGASPNQTPKLIEDIFAANHTREVVKELRQQLKPLGGLKLYRFLEALGYPLVVPEARRKAFLFRLGLTDKQESLPAWPEQFFSACETLSHLSGESPIMLNHLLGLYSGGLQCKGRVQPICTIEPKCPLCVVKNYCAWYRYRKPRTDNARTARIKEMAESERPRERLLAVGAQGLSDSELLAILIRTGSGELSALDLARRLLERFKSLRRIDQASIAEISAVHGIGAAKATEIKAALELGKRLFPDDMGEDAEQFTNAYHVYHSFRGRLMHSEQENFYIVLLNSKNRIIRDVLSTKGTLEASLVHPREAFKEAIRDSAAAVIFVHNHPSGEVDPSPDDIQLTERLVKAGNILGIRVLDHVIIGRNKYFSFSDENLL